MRPAAGLFLYRIRHLRPFGLGIGLTWAALSRDNPTTHTRSSKPKDHDFATVAGHVVEQAIGEKLTGKSPAAVALGRLGGRKGGAAEGCGVVAREAKGYREEGSSGAMGSIAVVHQKSIGAGVAVKRSAVQA